MTHDARRKTGTDEMVPPIAIARTPSALRETVRAWRAEGTTIGLVPTMGALHDGHLSLVERARREAQRTVVSIFVNPAQFSPSEDLDRYPRTFESDCAQLREAGADLVYAPSVANIYPAGFCTRVVVDGPAKVGLEDAARPHFFDGVATVVAKLLLQIFPDIAIFGEKDFQQLRVVAALVRDLDIPVKVMAAPTVREADGLAMSSRNRLLSSEERHRAVTLSAALFAAAAAMRAGTPVNAAISAARDAILTVGGTIDYLEARDAETLAPVEHWSSARPTRLLVAARLGAVRLIDNVAV